MPEHKHPTKEKGSRVQVFRIPANGDPAHVIEVGLCIYDEVALDADSRRWEKNLGHVPDLSRYRKSIDLLKRALFHRDGRVDGAGLYDDSIDGYCVYKNFTGKEQNRNIWFDEWEDSRAFGDVFIFRPFGLIFIDGEYRSDFDDMRKFARNFKEDETGWAWKIVRKMGSW